MVVVRSCSLRVSTSLPLRHAVRDCLASRCDTYEVRTEADYFDDIPEEKIPKDMLDLASHIVKTKAGHFEPSKFED
jgi:hypothetical protein